MIPSHPKDGRSAPKIGYKPYQIDGCPAKAIWRGTYALLSSPAFAVSMRYRELPVAGGGALDQPALLGELVYHARKEVEWFYELVAERRRDEK